MIRRIKKQLRMGCVGVRLWSASLISLKWLRADVLFRSSALMNNAGLFGHAHMQAAISGTTEAESLISPIGPSVCVSDIS